ncbi:MAG: HAMP domain-containing histidine kinase [Campylobacterales bacterium]|nr:HAMP domain-containing histidine kinase [Campylobacterales bacterium]
MIKFFKNLSYKTTINHKIFIGIITISILGIFISSASIEKLIGDHIIKNVKGELKNLGDRFYFSIRSHYKIFFLEYAHDKEMVTKASEAAKKETINDLKEMFAKEDINSYLITKSQIIQLSGDDKNYVERLNLLTEDSYKDVTVYMKDKYIIYERKFLPWEWKLVLVKNNQDYEQTIFENNILIVSTIGGLVILILFFLGYFLNHAVTKPINKILNFLQHISKGQYHKLDISNSIEFSYFTQGINLMVEEIKKREDELNFEKNLTRTILDTQHDIVILNNGHEIIDVNLSFFEFFNKYKDLNEFKQKHSCICEFFIEKDGYITPQIDGMTWVEYLLKYPKKINQAIVNKDGKNLFFNLNAKNIKIKDKEFFIITMSDVTELEMYKQDLENKIQQAIKKNSEQEHILYQQAKSSQMGQMLSMIAHQWRQPLNAISASSINVSLLNDMDMLDDEKLSEHTNFIQQQTLKMCKTIDDFMNFFKPEKDKNSFSFDSVMEQIFSLIGAQFKSRDIKMIYNVAGVDTIYSYQKELEHVLINIIANSRDAYENTQNVDKIITIDVKNQNDNLIIKICDNAGGIEPENLDSIFNPYFTTKEQGKGTGIGLYMTKKIITEVFHGDIRGENIENGACFTLEIPIK